MANGKQQTAPRKELYGVHVTSILSDVDLTAGVTYLLSR